MGGRGKMIEHKQQDDRRRDRDGNLGPSGDTMTSFSQDESRVADERERDQITKGFFKSGGIPRLPGRAADDPGIAIMSVEFLRLHQASRAIADFAVFAHRANFENGHTAIIADPFPSQV